MNFVVNVSGVSAKKCYNYHSVRLIIFKSRPLFLGMREKYIIFAA